MLHVKNYIKYNEARWGICIQEFNRLLCNKATSQQTLGKVVPPVCSLQIHKQLLDIFDKFLSET